MDKETGKVHRSHDVAFKEDEFPFAGTKTEIGPTPLVVIPRMQDSDDDVRSENNDIEDLGENGDQAIVENPRKRTADITILGGLDRNEPAIKRRFGRDDLSIEMHWKPASSENLSASRSTRSRIADTANAMIAQENSDEMPQIIDFAYLATQGPRTYEEALRSENA